jgi:hypothetical protein
MSFFEFPHTRTYDSDLGWLIRHTKSAEEAIDTLNAWVAENEPTIDNLAQLYIDLTTGQLPEAMTEAINNWLSHNAADIVTQLIKMVFFGLTDDGYFVAYIPDSWDDITFGTSGLDDFPSGVDFGHLTLSY